MTRKKPPRARATSAERAFKAARVAFDRAQELADEMARLNTLVVKLAADFAAKDGSKIEERLTRKVVGELEAQVGGALGRLNALEQAASTDVEHRLDVVETKVNHLDKTVVMRAVYEALRLRVDKLEVTVNAIAPSVERCDRDSHTIWDAIRTLQKRVEQPPASSPPGAGAQLRYAAKNYQDTPEQIADLKKRALDYARSLGWEPPPLPAVGTKTRCASTHPTLSTWSCSLDNGHPGSHRHENGSVWRNDSTSGGDR